MARQWPVQVPEGDVQASNVALAIAVVLACLSTSPLLWVVMGMPSDFTVPLLWAFPAFVIGCFAAWKAMRWRLERLAAGLAPVEWTGTELVVTIGGKAYRIPVDEELRVQIRWKDSMLMKRNAATTPAGGRSIFLMLERPGLALMLSDPYECADARAKELPFGAPPKVFSTWAQMAAPDVIEVYEVLAAAGAPIYAPARTFNFETRTFERP